MIPRSRHDERSTMRKFPSAVGIVLTVIVTTVTSTVFSQPYWDTQYPGAPTSGPPITTIAATNGTVYAVAGSDLLSWSLCDGWTTLASFTTSSVPQSPFISSLYISGGKLYVGGAFWSMSVASCGLTVNATNVASYDLNTGAWAQVGDTTAFKTNLSTPSPWIQIRMFTFRYSRTDFFRARPIVPLARAHG